MNKKSFKKERAQLDKAAEQLAKYLNIAQEFTEDYHETLNLGKDINTILTRDGDKLKRIEAMIFICREKLKFPGYEINCTSNGFSVNVLHIDYPF